MVRPSITDDDRIERLEAIKEYEGIDSNAAAVRVLIDEAYDDLPGESLYDPTEERMTPLDTETIREICWRYDAPAINPDHVMSWPRDRPDKRDLLAAICRFEGVSSEGEVRWQIKKHLGEGDPIVSEKVKGEHNEDKRHPRNIYHYLHPVVNQLQENPPELADNLPANFHDIDGVFADHDGVDVDTASAWIDDTREAMERDLPAAPFEARLDLLDRAVEEPADDHPGVAELQEFRPELVAHIEGLESDGDDSDE